MLATLNLFLESKFTCLLFYTQLSARKKDGDWQTFFLIPTQYILGNDNGVTLILCKE